MYRKKKLCGYALMQVNYVIQYQYALMQKVTLMHLLINMRIFSKDMHLCSGKCANDRVHVVTLKAMLHMQLCIHASHKQS